MACPLCDHNRKRLSWFGSLYYGGREFPYVQCLSCYSHYCNPMPDDKILLKMYGEEYVRCGGGDSAIEDPKEPQRVIEWLMKVKAGIFIDYGCGSGSLLTDAARLHWQVLGVEFDEDIARTVAQRTGVRVVNRFQTQSLKNELADVLHVGDVIEHLTDLPRQIPEILRLIKPGGLLLAQGPLEGNAHLFNLVLKIIRSVRRSHFIEMAPYHVTLATARGQRGFFQRCGLKEVEFTVSEKSWPAPGKFLLSHLWRPRSLALFVLRRISQAISTLHPQRWGNRYFYVGRRDSSLSSNLRV